MKKERALKLAIYTLGILAVVDLIRGLLHTFLIMYASEHIAQMTQTPDTLMLMTAFGVANILSGATYILVIKKAKELVPYLLILIPLTYLIGFISMNVTGISALQTSAWNGQYMLMVYMTVSTLAGLNYFIVSYSKK